MKKRTLLRWIALLISLSAVLAFTMMWIPTGGGTAVTPDPGSQEQIPEKLKSQDGKNEDQSVSASKRSDSVSLTNPNNHTSESLAQETFYSLADADVTQGNPWLNDGSDEQMVAGYDGLTPDPGYINRSLVFFYIASLPPDQIIIDATLRVFLDNSFDSAGIGRTITTYRITSNWAESTVTWDNSPAYGEGYGSQSVNGASSWYEFDVTNLVRNWYDGSFQNYGLMLRGPEMSGTYIAMRFFGTRESMYDPELVVQYEPKPLPPIIAGLPDKEILVDTSLDNAIDLWAYANDHQDTDADLSFTINNNPNSSAGVSIDSNRYIDINPSAGWTGVTNVAIEVMDTDGYSDIDSFQVRIFGEIKITNLPIVHKN